MDAVPTYQLRSWWANYRCGAGSAWSKPLFYGRPIGKVPIVTLSAYKALEAALRNTGYNATNVWSYNCRYIAGTSLLSLHSYGIAIDIDPAYNLFSAGYAFSGKLKEQHVEAVEAIENYYGDQVWSWGGRWPYSKDRMHFQLNVPPTRAIINWQTVQGAVPPKPEVKLVTYRGVINIPENDLKWAKPVIDRRIESGLIINTDNATDDWSRDGRLWIFFDRALSPMEKRLAALER